MSPKTRNLRVICLASYAVLCLQQLTDAWLGGAPPVVWIALLVPLLLFLPGMQRDNLRSFVWLCFVSLLYFMLLVVDLFEQPQSVLRWAGMLAVVGIYSSGMLYVRWRARELRGENAQQAVEATHE
ncbi:DUF2069 domain-containing protein [Mangrovimicrobium sediminis]|uniref:DUF2069 domain-containing protein n=1 Tax=Mangrovimicrobium sediminis TaxID=2562682 RepID=A0A4Z0LXG3_9GAMM|nr:DUF2069 domain-containing protein [Haliea sp. SAOS-164]TGD72063.1 DUF2069 domain-containing protein [Haliea sp. SAOS-164]